MGISAIAWGSKVSDVFLERVKWIVDDLDIGYAIDDGCSKLMACMAWESNETFSAGVRNMAGSGATGLIQFMPSTATGLGTTVDRLASMTPEDQLNYVWKYFEPYRGRLKTLGDIYMAILWPKGVGKPETYVLWDKHSKPTTYRQNSGLDLNRDGAITKAEATAKVAEKLSKGMTPPNVLETILSPFTPAAQEQERLDAEPVAQVTEPAPTLTLDDITVYEPGPEAPPKPPKAEAVKKAASSREAKVLGVLMILGSLFANPDFALKLGAFTTAVARGDASWSALLSLLGAALLVYTRSSPRT